MDRLYLEAEQATEAYNAAGEHAGSLRRQVGRAQDRIARQQDRVNAMRDALGTLAGAQYRSGGLASSLELLFSDNPPTTSRRRRHWTGSAPASPGS